MSNIRFKQGDIIWVGFDPALGHEQKGIRPALVVSNELLNQSGMYFCCPITTKAKPYPTRIPLDSRTKTQGYILLDQGKPLDLEIRGATKKEDCPADILEDVVASLTELFAIL